MIAAICDAINVAMTDLGYVETADEEQLRERRYMLRFDPVIVDQGQRGTIVAGRARISWIVHVRIQYPSAKHQERWRRGIAEAQETVGLALYILSIAHVSQVWNAASMEERPDGIVSDIAIRFLGDVS